MSLLKEALESHDENPGQARSLLARIEFSTLEDNEKNTYFWLINHVVGELLSDWESAFLWLNANKCEGMEAYFKFLSVAAYFSGHPVQAFNAEFEYSRLANVSVSETKALVNLLCVQSARGDESIVNSLTLLSNYASSFISPASPVTGKSMAAALNNIVSKLIEDPRLEADDPFHKHTTIEAALICKQLWRDFGVWVNHERSLYLCALTFNRFSEWKSSVDCVEEALGIIASNGSENVDKAFLLLELAKAQQGLGYRAEAENCLDEADCIARDFDSHLKQWFAGRRSEAISPLSI